ncbi:MAG: hypothetical protein R3249_06990 [Nitriliruptorales bacterium]|nr:hypothetical protein [Nitriliruptorales bacterium]
MASDNSTPERPATTGGAGEARAVAPGGVRRVLWGLGMGAVLGFVAAALSPRPDGPRRRT